MKIISLRFANLNSLPGPHLIRFDQAPLADTGLFAITGPTGAGKSTLLDAIAVGLYGRVPRHDRQVGEMVSRHAPEAWSEVEFEVHQPAAEAGQPARVRYRSRWEVKRKRRGEDKGGLNQDAMTLVRCLPGTDAVEAVESGKEKVPARVGELSGLDFGQFEQAVLLSQGKFARFLHARETERSALLEKMTNVGIYSQLGAAAFEKAKEEEQQTRLLEAHLHATHLLPAPERERLEQQLDALHQDAEDLYLHHQDVSDCLAWRLEHDRLAGELAGAEADLAHLHATDLAQQPAWQQLARHEQAAAPALTTALAVAGQLAQALTHGSTALAELAQQLPTLQAAAQATAAQATEAAAQAAAAQAEADRQAPLLHQAQEQDAALAAARRELTRRHAAYATEQAAYEAARGAWHHTQATALTAGQQQQADLEQWLLAHQYERTLREELEEINRELLALQEVHTELATLEARQEAQLAQLAEAAAERQRHQEAAAQAEADQHALAAHGQPARDEQAALLAGTDPTALARRLTHLAARGRQLQALLPLVQAAHEHAAQARTLAAEVTAQAPALAEAEATSATLAQDLADQRRVLAALQLALRAQQARADLNAHRRHLQAGQPCPLCGALEHLLAPDFEADADAHEQHMARQQVALEQLQARHTQAAQALAGLQATRQQRHARQLEATAAAEAAKSQAEALAAQSRAEALADALGNPTALPATTDTQGGGTDLLTPPLVPQAVAAALAATTAAQDQAEATQRRLAQLHEQLTRFQAEQQAAAARAAQAQAEAHRADLRHQHTQRSLAPLAAALAEARQQAAAYRQVVNGLLRPHQLSLPALPAAYPGLLSELGERADTYAARHRALADCRHHLAQLHQQQALQADTLAATAARLAAQQAELAATETALAAQQAERLARYPGPDPTAEAERLRQTARQLAQAAQQTEAAHARHQQALATAQAQQAERQREQTRYQAEQARHQTELAAALQAVGFPDAAAAQAALLPPAEAQRLTQHRQQHRTSLAAAAQRQAQLAHALARHQEVALTAQPAPALKAELTQLQAETERLHQRLGAVASQLAHDDDARQQQAEGLRQLEARQREQQRWQDLADQIGSAKGDKFSRFAQGLTLNHLARLANHRLGQLTPRYTILKTPGQDLELQIIDHDQADTVRPMASLSGGESFLVSLALALGLSELAGHQARIESLFIDEGFGTLDPDALTTALDALERLQHTGKTIGVISHVADLKDRITTQIQVQPTTGGNSTVRLVDVMGHEHECRG